jgi:tetratricopeptide (TPR) repeat protein
MKTTGLRFVLILALLLASTPEAAAAEKWINLTTSNFNIVSNAGEGDTRRLALKLEQFHAIFSKLFNANAASVPVTVMVFKNDSSFKPFKPLYNGKPKDVAGYFQRAEDENIIALDITPRREHPLAVVLHEYTHLLTSASLRRWPVWLSEGLAELYSTFDVQGKEVIMGKPVSAHVYLLREKFIPLDQLFQVDRQSSQYNERTMKGIFYAESWALTHYLMFGKGGARRQQLINFVAKMGAGVSPEKAFGESITTDLKSLEKELMNYVQNSNYPGWIITLDSTEGAREFTARVLSEGEVKFFLGNLLARTSRLDEAEVYLKEAVALDPALPRVYEGLGLIALRRRNHAEAMVSFKEAVTRGSRSHLAHYYYAQSLLSESKGPMNDQLAARILQLLETSVSLMPNFAPPHYLIGWLSLTSNAGPQRGIDAVRRAIALSPQSDHYYITLAELQLKAGDNTAAKQTIKSLLESGSNAGILASARNLLERIERRDSIPSRAGSEPGLAADDSGAPRLTAAKEPPDEHDTSRGPASKYPTAKSWPTLKIEGAIITHGVISAFECRGNTWTVVFKTQTGDVRYLASNIEKVEFYSQNSSDDKIGCGSVNKPAFIYFKPAAKPGAIAGEVLALEFTKP